MSDGGLVLNKRDEQRLSVLIQVDASQLYMARLSELLGVSERASDGQGKLLAAVMSNLVAALECHREPELTPGGTVDAARDQPCLDRPSPQSPSAPAGCAATVPPTDYR